MLDFLSPRKLLTQLTLGAGLVAAQLQTISNFGPTYDTRLVMQAYVPSNLPANAAVMVAVSDRNIKVPFTTPQLTRTSASPLWWHWTGLFPADQVQVSRRLSWSHPHLPIFTQGL